MTTRTELIEQASPPCHLCGSPVQRVEQQWAHDDEDGWVLASWVMVCAYGHRVPVEP